MKKKMGKTIIEHKVMSIFYIEYTYNQDNVIVYRLDMNINE